MGFIGRLHKIIKTAVDRSTGSELTRKKYKNLKDKVVKSIKEAIAKIEDTKLREHFESSFKVVAEKYGVVYDPVKNIDWKTL